MSDIMDLRGLSCPQPVMRVRKAIQESGASTVEALVDSHVARDNIVRAAQSLGWRARVNETEDGFHLSLQAVSED